MKHSTVKANLAHIFSYIDSPLWEVSSAVRYGPNEFVSNVWQEVRDFHQVMEMHLGMYNGISSDTLIEVTELKIEQD